MSQGDNPSEPGRVQKALEEKSVPARAQSLGRVKCSQSARDGGQAPGWSGARTSIGCRADCSDLMHHGLFKGHRLFPGSGVELTASGWGTDMGRRGEAVNIVLPNHTAI